jgi:4-methyl-5(b-hydroxyethyl)-thiazole monophosphate biosynthesis
MAKRAITFLAEGFEEVEAVTPVDFLRRAGVEVCIASITADKTVKGARGVSIAADTVLDKLKEEGRLLPSHWDAVFIPGGMPGASNLAASAPVGSFIRDMASAGKIHAAICASPAVVLAPLGLLEGKRFTCYPGMERKVSGGIWVDEKVVIDGALITSRAPGTAAAFALALIRVLGAPGEDKKLVKDALLEGSIL